MADGIDIVRAKQNGRLRGIFHCFGGSAEEAGQIIDLGFYLGIGGVATFKKSTLPEVLKDISWNISCWKQMHLTWLPFLQGQKK